LSRASSVRTCTRRGARGGGWSATQPPIRRSQCAGTAA
jgi:hypothetical protein